MLKDYTVLKVMLSAVLVGMLGVYTLKKYGYINLHPKPCFVKTIVIGGLIFGAGFAILGYCPGTAAGALGSGSIDALFGIIGFLIGAGIFAHFYLKIKKRYMKVGYGNITLPELLNVNPFSIIVIISSVIILFFYFLEISGY